MTASRQTTAGGDPAGYAMGYTYDLGGALAEETYPSGRVVKNVLDASGDLSMVQSAKCLDGTPSTSGTCTQQAGLWSYAKNFTYNAAGAVTSMQLGNGRWESTEFNSRLQPVQIALGATQNTADLLKLDYAYGTTQNNGNVQSQTITVPTVGVNNGFTAVQNYTYDELNRLKSAVENVTPTGGTASQAWKQTFTFDRYGNRNFDEANTTTLPQGCLAAVCNPQIDPANNRLIGYGVDSAGNTATDASGQTFIYDGDNKQVQVNNAQGVVGQYLYDGDGKRVKKYVPSTGEVTVFVYDAGGKLAAEYSTIVEAAQDAKVSYLTNDHLGSPRINTDATGAVTARHDYHPFGEEVFTAQRTTGLGYASDTIRKQFTSYERDTETDFDFAQARMYANRLGRFTSPDPLFF
ncbi:MAG: cell well associated RhsD protein [Acidobacteria bacterium OLB17]|nr:MAG: cell well associated RhsD protein [Acidobacteria bacterium OLB17]